MFALSRAKLLRLKLCIAASARLLNLPRFCLPCCRRVELMRAFGRRPADQHMPVHLANVSAIRARRPLAVAGLFASCRAGAEQRLRAWRSPAPSMTATPDRPASEEHRGSWRGAMQARLATIAAALTIVVTGSMLPSAEASRSHSFQQAAQTSERQQSRRYAKLEEAVGRSYFQIGLANTSSM